MYREAYWEAIDKAYREHSQTINEWGYSEAWYRAFEATLPFEKDIWQCPDCGNIVIWRQGQVYWFAPIDPPEPKMPEVLKPW